MPRRKVRRFSTEKIEGLAERLPLIGGLLTGACAKARRVHLVLNNLNTHFRKCFDDVLGQRAATKLLRRVQFHYTPKHASWLNMAEIEIGIHSRQGLNRRIASRQLLRSEVEVWQQAKRPSVNHRVEIYPTGCRYKAWTSLCFVTYVFTY